VSRRANEIGVRMALGAQRLDVVRMILHESLVLVGAGVPAGLVVALPSSRLIAAQLYGLQPTDPATIGLAVLVLLTVSALAGSLPSRRAACVDPALRTE
jgi:ABC-type antimicrobial peptide transport system permease subunit